VSQVPWEGEGSHPSEHCLAGAYHTTPSQAEIPESEVKGLMKKLYVYNFGLERYMVDDSGKRWKNSLLPQDVGIAIPAKFFCEECKRSSTSCFQNEQGTIVCANCFDGEHIDLAADEGKLLLDKGMGIFQMIESLERHGMKVTERHEDGEVVLYHPGCAPFTPESYTRWREITLGGCLYGYSYEGEVDDPEDDGLDDWVDSHSVTCHCCGNMADERKTTKLTPDAGEICPQCSSVLQEEINKAKKSLRDYTSEDFNEDVEDIEFHPLVLELACRVTQLRAHVPKVTGG
jgi:hypothetical protein